MFFKASPQRLDACQQTEVGIRKRKQRKKREGRAAVPAAAPAYSDPIVMLVVSSRAIIQREHELGVRIALGASIQQIRTLILRQGTIPVAFGILAGIAGAAGCGLFLQHLFVGINVSGVMAFVVPSLFLLLIAIGTAWSATTRVLVIDPIEAIRAEH